MPNVSVQSSSSELPSWLQGPLSTNIQNAQATAATPYQQYGGARVADFTQPQQSAFNQINGLQGVQQPYLNQAGAAINSVQNQGIGSLYSPTQYNAQSINPGSVNTQNFDQGAASQYMNPYQQGVVDPTMHEIQRQSDIQKIGNNAQAVQAGAFGGDRSAVLNAETQRNTDQIKAQTLANLNLQGYQNAQSQFNQDQSRNLAGQEFNQNNNLQGQLYNSQSNLQQQQMSDQSRLNAGNMASNDLNRRLQVGQAQAGLGGTAQSLGLQGANAQMQIGSQQQQQNQNNLNTAYSDFLAQRNYPYTQEGFMANILQGAPMTPSTTSTYSTPTNYLQSVAGLGLTGLGVIGGTGGFNSSANGGSTGWLSGLGSTIGNLFSGSGDSGGLFGAGSGFAKSYPTDI